MTEPAGARLPQADVRRLRRGRSRQRGHGHADRVGSRPRRLPRQGARQLAHRPALRAADDRRRPDAARPLRAKQPDRDQHRLHPDGDRRRAALRDAARSWCARCNPCCIELDREMEEAAASLGRRRLTIFRRDRPSRTSSRPSSPASALAFARAHRRVRLGRADLRATSRSRPRSRRCTSSRPGRERQRRGGRGASRVVLLAISLAGAARPSTLVADRWCRSMTE